MSLDLSESTEPATGEPGARPARWGKADTFIVGGFLLLALFLYNGLWLDLGEGYLWNSAADQNQWEWYVSVTADNVLHGRNPLTTNLQNAPLSVNMMANASMFGLAIPLAPLTLTFGPTLTWAIVLTAGLAGTAAAWYWVFSRHLVRHRTGAVLGGLFCGFAPPMISHGNAHPNFVVLFVLPFIFLKVIQIAKGQRPVRNGVWLGVLTAFQIFLGEEPLMIFALGFLVFVVAYFVTQFREFPPMIKPLAKGLGVGIGIFAVLVAFPLWWQFFGPQSFQSLHHGPSGNDAAAMTRFATQSLAGDAKAAADVSMNRTEENAFFGWPLIGLMVLLTVWLWREAVARSLAISMFLMAWLSLGVKVEAAHEDTWFPAPWALLAHLPLFDSLLESRLAMAAIPAIGALLAIAVDRVFTLAGTLPEPAPGQRKIPLRTLWVGVLGAVLLPIVPVPLVVKERPASPDFFTQGVWRTYVDPGGTLVPVPLVSTGESEPLHWQMDAGLGYSMPEGYFVGPSGPNDPRGRYGADPRPTSKLFEKVRESGDIPQITDTQRAETLKDLRYWKADVLVLIPRDNDDALRGTVDLLLRKPGQFVDGVWVWDVRSITP